MSITKFQRILASIVTQPRYSLMRLFARFSILRYLVPLLRGQLRKGEVGKHVVAGKLDKVSPFFDDIKADKAVSELLRDGASHGLTLPKDVVQAIYSYAKKNPCYADRDVSKGFLFEQHEIAQNKLGKSILVAQYFNTTVDCPEINRLAQDPTLNRIAHQYLQSTPTFVGANLWWTFPVDASEEDRSRHAHLFHRDVDDFRFFKFFFYLTDVNAGDGAHVLVRGSQGNPPVKSFFDRWNLRRYSDEEVLSHYPENSVMEICGKAGSGFAEDTWCLHKGQTPVKKPRLLLQLQFALFDYGAMHDRRETESLVMLNAE